MSNDLLLVDELGKNDLAFLLDSKWACFGISMGQLVSAGILWIFYNRAVKKIEQMNLEMEELT